MTLHDLCTDDELLTLVRDGDRGAFGELYRRNRRAAVRLARMMRLADDAEDVAADAFVAVLAAIDNGHGPTRSFASYLFRAVRNAGVKRMEANKRIRPLFDDDLPPVPFGDTMHPVDSAHLWTVFAGLSMDHRRLLWQLDVCGLRPSDLAAAGSANAVSARAYRARRALRAAFEDASA